MSLFKKIVLLLIVAGALDIGRYLVYPDVSDLRDIRPIPTAFMEYRMDEWAAQNRDVTLHQRWVGFTDISPNVVKAVLIGEDDKFWNHAGFDMTGMEQALERSLKKGSVAGGSTITQQLAKNLYLSPSKNPVRKLKEAILTWRIENTLTKRQILEIYLNIAEWGDGIFGIEAAARHYYHKSAKNLSAREAARLAAVLPNPIKYNPTGSQKYVKNRAKIIYKIMKRRGIVIPHYQEVMAPPIPALESTESNASTLFPSAPLPTENEQPLPENGGIEATSPSPTGGSDNPTSAQ